MNSNLREYYKVNRDAVQESFVNQMGLKMNKEYEKWADDSGIEIIKYFLDKYKGVKIELPKSREKSPKSLLGKIKNLQIERLSKLYAIEGISNKDKKALYLLIKERINENEDLDADNILKEVKKLLNGDVNNMNIKKFEQAVMVEGISRSTKTALLRILVSKIEKSSLYNKEDVIKKLDRKYGKEAVVKSGLPEDDIIKYDSIVNLRNNPSKLNRLRNEKKFLKANDLRGMKIVAVDIPDDFETNNYKIKKILERRKEATTSKERIIYTHLAIVELGKEFYRDLENNKELLEKLNMKVIPDSSKHKKKTNGYEAEHIKFINSKEPEYTLELQFKSEYVETICRGTGSASHENRPGKSRILPEASSKKELIEKLDYMVPKYKVFRIEQGNITVHSYSMLKNVIGYFQGQISQKTEEYDRIIEALSSDEENQKAI